MKERLKLKKALFQFECEKMLKLKIWALEAGYNFANVLARMTIGIKYCNLTKQGTFKNTN